MSCFNAPLSFIPILGILFPKSFLAGEFHITMSTRCDRRIVFDIDPETGEVEEYEWKIGKKPLPLIRPRIEKKESEEDEKDKVN